MPILQLQPIPRQANLMLLQVRLAVGSSLSGGTHKSPFLIGSKTGIKGILAILVMVTCLSMFLLHKL
jgi:hypothetical protein